MLQSWVCFGADALDKLDNYGYTVGMKKQMISFTEPQLDYLKREAERFGIPVAEFVRRIIDQYRSNAEDDQYRVALEKRQGEQ